MATPHHPSSHGPVPGNPYSASGEHGYAPAPGNYAPAPGGYAGPAPTGYAPPAPACRACGGQAAANFKVRSHMGILILMRFEHLDGPFCRACGIAVVRQMTTRTLCLGWWGPLSLVILNPFTLVWNLFAYLKYSKLPRRRPPRDAPTLTRARRCFGGRRHTWPSSPWPGPSGSSPRS